MIHVAIRFDDPSVTSNRVVEQGVIDALRNTGLVATFAAIPFVRMNGELVPLDADNAGHMVSAVNEGVIEIAQHGFCHQRAFEQDPPSEFVAVPLHEQQALVKSGRDRLQFVFGTRPTGFVPPWNTYDRNTLTVLALDGFDYISAGWRGPAPSIFANIPRTCQAYQVREAIESLRASNHAGAVVGVMHHYDFAESTSDSAVWNLAAFETLMIWLKHQPDVTVVTLGQLTRIYSRHELNQAMRTRRLGACLPWRWRLRIPDKCLIRSHALPVLMRALRA